MKFNIKGAFLLQELIFTIRESNFFVGGRYSYLGSDIEFKLFDDVQGAVAEHSETRGTTRFV